MTANSNYINDRNLSLKAKGILFFLLSQPSTWDPTEAKIVNYASDSLTAVRSGIKELIKHGYLTRQRIREPNGNLAQIKYSVYKEPNHA